MTSVRQGYKKTDVGIIPEGWEVNTIKSVTHVATGGTPSTANPEFWIAEIPWMRSGDIHKKVIRDVKGRISKLGLNASAATLLPKNCVLIALAGQGKTRGTVAINEIELSTNQSIASIYPASEYCSKYLYYYLDSQYFGLRSMSQGDGGRGGLNISIINKIKFPCPNVAEQKEIAAALSDIDALIEAKEALLEKKRAIKLGAMQELLTGKKRLLGFPVTPMKHTEVGEIPEDWDLKKLEQVAYYPKEREVASYMDANSYVSCENMVKNRRGVNFPGTPPLTGSAGKYSQGDILIGNIRPYLKKVWCSDKSGSHSMDVLCIHPLIDNAFLYHVLSTDAFFLYIMSAIKGTKMPRGDRYHVLQYNLPVPSSQEEQRCIAAALSDMDSEIESLEQEIAKLRDLKQGMMQNLLTGRIRLV